MRADIEIAGAETGAHLEATRGAAARTAAALARIDALQSNAPQCWICGQRTAKPDRFGLCSKSTPPHVAERQRQRRDA